MKTKNNILTFLSYVIAVLMVFITFTPLKASASSITVRTSKSNYNYNETITVSYTGGKNDLDWVGIYKEGITPGRGAKTAALAYHYLNENGTKQSGTFNFTPSDFINREYSPQKGCALEPGRYKAVFGTNDSYNIPYEYSFTVGGGDPEYSFDVLSDAHITAGDSVTDSNLAYALQDISSFSNNCKAVIFNGDSVDEYDWNGYQTLKDIVAANGKDLPFKFFSLGNHELFDSSHASDYTTTPYSYKLNRFFTFADSINRACGNTNSDYLKLYSDCKSNLVPYYKTEVNKDSFVFIGSQSVAYGDKADLTDQQIDWLDEDVLYPINKYKENQPIFVFGHGGVNNTVAGTFAFTNRQGKTENWDGIAQYGKLSFVLNKYPNVFYFSGHSHWNLNVNNGPGRNIMSEGKATYNTSKSALYFTDGGVANSWTPSTDSQYGATGLHVDVYKDKVVVKARDYINKSWINGGRYSIDLTSRYNILNDLMKGM